MEQNEKMSLLLRGFITDIELGDTSIVEGLNWIFNVNRTANDLFTIIVTSYQHTVRKIYESLNLEQCVNVILPDLEGGDISDVEILPLNG